MVTFLATSDAVWYPVVVVVFAKSNFHARSFVLVGVKIILIIVIEVIIMDNNWQVYSKNQIHFCIDCTVYRPWKVLEISCYIQKVFENVLAKLCTMCVRVCVYVCQPAHYATLSRSSARARSSRSGASIYKGDMWNRRRTALDKVKI